MNYLKLQLLKACLYKRDVIDWQSALMVLFPDTYDRNSQLSAAGPSTVSSFESEFFTSRIPSPETLFYVTAETRKSRVGARRNDLDPASKGGIETERVSGNF